MADNPVVNEEMVVDERVLEGYLVAAFVWIRSTTWAVIKGRLPMELRLEVQRTFEIDGDCIVLPRIIWKLVQSVADVPSVLH